MSESAKAVFLSYASQDVEAAQRICEALRAAGVEVWLDQSELVGGDAWDRKIRGQIATCALHGSTLSSHPHCLARPRASGPNGYVSYHPMKLIGITTLLALTLALSFGCKRAQPSPKMREGYVLKAAEGEKVMGNILIKADPRTGSIHASMFTMTVAPRDFIPLHVHTLFDEFFFVHEGSGFATLGAKRIPISKGDIIFVPKGSDHKFENPQPDRGLELVYFIDEPGLEGKFREYDARMKKDSRPMSLQESNEIAGRHGDIMKEARK